MENPVDDSSAKAERALKQPYHAPSLVEYGSVRSLTTGGTAGTVEGAMMTNLMRRA